MGIVANGKFNNLLSRRGFTIVELLIVIVVIGILAAIIIVSYTGITAQAHVATAQQSLRDRVDIIARFKAENDHYPTTTSDSTWLTSNVLSSTNLSYVGTSGTTYCLQYVDGSIVYAVNDTTTRPAAGSCTVGPTPTAGTVTTNTIPLTWTNLASPVNGYIVQTSRSSSFPTGSNDTATVAVAGTPYTKTGLKAGTTYYARLAPTTAGVQGAYGASVSKTTTSPAAPGSLTSASILGTSFTFGWGAVADINNYGVQCALSADTAYATVKFSNTAVATNSVSVTGLTASTAYICHVRAQGYNAQGSYSTNLTVTTSS